MKSTSDLMGIVSAKGGIVIDASSKSTSDLMGIASAAASSGATVIFASVGSKSTSDLMGIASAGKGHVILDLR
jgi:hypothetical protein